MDKLRYPRTETTSANNVSPPHNGNRLSQPNLAHDLRHNLPRRFTAESGPVPTLSSNIPAAQRGPDTLSDSVHAAGAQARQKVHLLEKKKLEYEKLLTQKRHFELEMVKLDQAQRREAQELAQMEQDLASGQGHHSEPTTPPECANPPTSTLNAFGTLVSRQNRYSTPIIHLPTGSLATMLSEETRPSPQEEKEAMFTSLHVSHAYGGGAGDDSEEDDDDKELAVRQDPTSHLSTNRSNRYSMPVTRSRNPFYDLSSLDQTNVTGFLFGHNGGNGGGNDHRFSMIEDKFDYPSGWGDLDNAQSVAAGNSTPVPATAADMNSSSRPTSIHRSMELGLVEPAAAGPSSAAGHVNINTPPRLQATYSANDIPAINNASVAMNHRAQQHLHHHNASMGRIPAGALPVRSTDNGINGVNNLLTPVRNYAAAYGTGAGTVGTPMQYSSPNSLSALQSTANALFGPMSAGQLANLPLGPLPVGQLANASVSPMPVGHMHAGPMPVSPMPVGPMPVSPMPVGQLGGYFPPAYNASTAHHLALMMTNMNLMNASGYQNDQMGPANLGHANVSHANSGHANLGQVNLSQVNSIPTTPARQTNSAVSSGRPTPRDSQQRVIESRRLQDNPESLARFGGKTITDFIGRIYEICKDQFGCRFLQRELDHGRPADVHAVWLEVYKHVVELMKDPFGNYLCQKLLEYCNQEDRTKLIEVASQDMVRIALSQHGTRALQKMIEHVGTPQQLAIITNALSGNVVELIQDTNGNHVIQKCLTKLAPHENFFILEAVGRNCIEVATHRHGTCVVQRCIDHAAGAQKNWLVERLIENALALVTDPYGNYVIQYVVNLDVPAYTDSIVASFTLSIVALSMQKFSSNVVEKCLRCSSDDTRDAMIGELLESGEIEHMVTDSFANYVIQTALDTATPVLKHELIEAIRPHLYLIRATPHGRRISAKVQSYDEAQAASAASTDNNNTAGAMQPLRLPHHALRAIENGGGLGGDAAPRSFGNFRSGPMAPPAATEQPLPLGFQASPARGGLRSQPGTPARMQPRNQQPRSQQQTRSQQQQQSPARIPPSPAVTPRRPPPFGSFTYTSNPFSDGRSTGTDTDGSTWL